jgi:hypothetical protein
MLGMARYGKIQEAPGPTGSKTTEIYPDGKGYLSLQPTIHRAFSNAVCTHDSIKSLSNTKNPTDDPDI